MPGKIKVKVLAGRNLPVMDRAGDTTDAFVEIKFGGVTHKTDVCRKSLNPHWNNAEWYRFEVDESELQDEPLQLRLMDHDTYSANDAIGKVVISLAPLLAGEANNAKTVPAPPAGAVMSGWIPVFDTMHGIRGELNVIVKVELFSDFNKYKTSSCGVQFFHCPMIPPGYRATAIHGFVEELVVNDDPEYQWIDKIRTPRASNEARQVAFIKLSNQVQRLVGLKAAELGANAVVGYQQDFDLEGEAGVVARAIGTAVNITPLPTPYQQINIPPCTQQELKKFLDILATDNESITDLNQYLQNHQDELQKLRHILTPNTPALLDETENADEDEKCMNLTRQSSVKSYVDNVSIYQNDYVSQISLKHISEDQTDLNKLLKGNEDSDSDSTGPLQKIKKIKANFFSKRFGGGRQRKADKQDDQISLKSNSSDTSRISLTDIRNEFKKLKRLKKPKFRKAFLNKEDEGIGMASILARSVIHAHTSLACIAETQDSEHSPSSTMRRTSESEPTINMSDEDKVQITTADTSVDVKSNQNDIIRRIPEVYVSLKNINTSDDISYAPQRKLSESCPATPMASRSDNLLKLPGEAGYFGSLSLSGESSEIYSSSDEEDESSDQKTDTEKSVETTSSVVQSVLNYGVDPVLVAQMDKKLSILQGVIPEIHEFKCTEEDNKQVPIIQSISSESSSENQDVEHNQYENVKQIEKRSTHSLMSGTKNIDTSAAAKAANSNYHFRFHNPFSHKKVSKSISAPSSPVEKTGFVYRSSKRIKRQISKISHSNMIKSISHYSLIPKKKHAVIKAASQPGSSSDLPSKVVSHETVLGSPFLSYADLLTLDKEKTDLHNQIHKSDDIEQREKVTMYIGSEPVSRASLSGPPFSYHKDEGQIFDHKSHKKDKPTINPTGLVHTAMETILIDKVQSLLVPTTPEVVQSKEKKFFDDINEKLVNVERARSKNETHKSDEHSKVKHSRDGHKTDGLLHTAIETILMDKVHSLLPTPDAMQLNESQFFTDITPKFDKAEDERLLNNNIAEGDYGKTEHDKRLSNSKDQKEKVTLVNTAMKTMLLDKLQSLIPMSSEGNQCHDDTTYSMKSAQTKNTSHGGLFQTAMETILMDKVQSLLSPSKTEPDYNNEIRRNKELNKVEKVLDKDEVSLIITAVEAVAGLVDKDQPLLSPAISSSNAIVEEFYENEREFETKLEHTTIQDKIEKKLVRQNSIHSITDENSKSQKMSKELDANIVIPCKVTQTKPVLQHFHPILSGPTLETIPSLPESSLDHTESLDVERLETTCECQSECDNETNIASVCDNSHAACRFDRSERDKEQSEKDKESPRHARHESYGGRDPVGSAQQLQNSSLNSTSVPVGIHRRSSDSDLSVTPKGGSLNASIGNAGSGGGAILRPSMNSNNLEMLEYPFLTMSEYPPGFIVHLGGTVCARSVKLVDAGGESAARAAWWAELRTELRAHARALRCNAVIAYSESAAICEDVCVLSALGTAAVINLDCDFAFDADMSGSNGSKTTLEDPESELCSIAHVPYSPGNGPYRAELSVCGGCKRALVPAVLLSTCAKPTRLPSFTKAVSLTAVATRVRRAPPASEPGARDISDQMPFLEYELQKLLLAKLRMQGANALFGLQTQIAIGERCVMALASGMAIRLTALPAPTPPRIKATENEKDAVEIQRALWDSFTANKAANGWDISVPENNTNGVLPKIEGEEPPVLDLCADKDACILELDEAEDVETAKVLATRRTNMQVFTNGLKVAPNVPPHAFMQGWRARFSLSSGQSSGASMTAEKHVARSMDHVTYKLRRLQPCALGPPRFHLELPEDEIQLFVYSTAVCLLDPDKPDDSSPVSCHSHSDSFISNPSEGNDSHLNPDNESCQIDDDIFEMDEEQMIKQLPSETTEDKNISILNGQTQKTVTLTTLSHVSGSRAARRICALRLLFVRETTAVRELGGLSGFLHTFSCEVIAIVRAYTAALGGNALTSLYLTQLMLQDNAHKNQGQCLLSIGGDVVHVTY